MAGGPNRLSVETIRLGCRRCGLDRGGTSWGATYIEFAFTRESQEVIETAFCGCQERNLLAYVELPSDEALFGSYYHADWENKDLNIPGNGEVADLVFSQHDPYDTCRPIRICFGSAPSDGDALVLQELGGYPMPATPNPAFKRGAP